jgi:hypothetical protein
MNTQARIAGMCLMSCALIVSASGADIVHREEIRKTFSFTAPSGTEKRLIVDNICGSIEVVGTSDAQISLIARKTIHAESDERVSIAQEKVKLEISEEPDRIRLYVDAPWRRDDGSTHGMDWEYYGYSVTFDFELRVPSKTDLYLKTINEGEISVKDIEGAFQVSNVNGGIEMSGLKGAGEFTTVNGNIKIGFARNPESSSTFKTVNGQVEVGFQGELSADLRLKTLNGEVYTDYEVAGLPSEAPERAVHGRKWRYRSGESYRVRAGHGGPSLSFDTLNGNIYIVRNHAD